VELAEGAKMRGKLKNLTNS